MELWDLFDKEGNFVRTFVRKSGRIPDGLYHKTVEIVPTDMKGHLLLTQRALTKRLGAGKFEFPAGSVISGETEQQAAVRELMEETGLKPKALYLLQKATINGSGNNRSGMKRYTYLAYIPDMTKAEMHFPPEEVMGHKIVTFDEWMALMTTSQYNHNRLTAYATNFASNLKIYCNKYADSTTLTKPEQEPKKEPMNRATGLAPKRNTKLDPRCYEQDDTPQRPENWEPEFEQGDDGT